MKQPRQTRQNPPTFGVGKGSGKGVKRPASRATPAPQSEPTGPPTKRLKFTVEVNVAREHKKVCASCVMDYMEIIQVAFNSSFVQTKYFQWLSLFLLDSANHVSAACAENERNELMEEISAIFDQPAQDGSNRSTSNQVVAPQSQSSTSQPQRAQTPVVRPAQQQQALSQFPF